MSRVSESAETVDAKPGRVGVHTGSYGCKCTMCRARRAKYSRDRHEKIRAGIPLRVPIGPVKAHVVKLIDRGMSAKLIAEVADVSSPTMYRVRNFDDDVLINATIAETLMSVRLDLSRLPPKSNVDVTGSRRRVQALAWCGWSLQLQAARYGMDATRFRIHRPETRLIWKGNADSIRAVYEELWDQDPPQATTQELRVVRFTKTWALKKGFMPPLAWDDETIDDPDAEPNMGLVTSSNGVTAEEVAFLRSFGKSDRQIAVQLGRTVDYIRKIEEAA